VSTDLRNALAFASVLAAGRYQKDPTLEQLQQLTPHIPDDEIEAKWSEVVLGRPVQPSAIAVIFDDKPPADVDPSKYRSWYFAVPGVHVRGSLYNFSLTRSPEDKIVLRGQHCDNLLTPRGGVLSAWAEEAHTWQKEHFGYDQLLEPTDGDGRPRWAWFQDNPVRDPSRRVPDYFTFKDGADPEPVEVEHGMQEGRPVPVCVLAYVFERGKDPNATQTHHDWKAVEDDADLIIHSSQALLWAEVKGANLSHGGCPTNYCALCGNSLHLTGCGHCNYLYRDNQFDTGGGPPIGPKAQALVEKFSNWTFTEDPQLARDASDERRGVVREPAEAVN